MSKWSLGSATLRLGYCCPGDTMAATGSDRELEEIAAFLGAETPGGFVSTA